MLVDGITVVKIKIYQKKKRRKEDSKIFFFNLTKQK